MEGRGFEIKIINRIFITDMDSQETKASISPRPVFISPSVVSLW